MKILYKKLNSCDDCPFKKRNDMFLDCNFCALLEFRMIDDMRHASDEDFAPNCPL